jgi:hypothetical protein
LVLGDAGSSSVFHARPARGERVGIYQPELQAGRLGAAAGQKDLLIEVADELARARSARPSPLRWSAA